VDAVDLTFDAETVVVGFETLSVLGTETSVLTVGTLASDALLVPADLAPEADTEEVFVDTLGAEGLT